MQHGNVAQGTVPCAIDLTHRTVPCAFNNQLGRQIALEYAGQGYDVFAQKIQEAIEGGQAYVITWDE